MDIVLTSLEARVIGCLIEKEITTPDQYPLSLNALTNACNQKSNREPVMDLDETVVQETVDGLIKKHLVSEKTGFGSRTTKYQHRFCNTEFGKLKLSAQELGILCVMLLRGPQTAGELRTRTDRLCRFADVGQVETTLQHLHDRDDGPFVVKLPRVPGQRESRWAHLLSGEVDVEDMQAAAAEPRASGGDNERLAALERQVEELSRKVELLEQELARLAG